MIFLTLIIQGVSLIKSSIIASYFGVSYEMDAYNFVNSIATFFFSFISSGITTVLVPAIITKKSNKSINTFLSVLYLVTIIIVGICFIFKDYIITRLSNNTSEYYRLASKLMLVLLVTQLLLSINSVTSAFLQCKNKYVISQLIQIVVTIILVGIIISDKNISIYKYSLYILYTTVLQIVIQWIITIKNGFKYNICFSLRDKEFINMLRIFLPTVVGAGLYQITLITDSMISSMLGSGQISILSYSNTIISMINVLFVTNLMTFIYPKITQKITTGLNNREYMFDYMTLFFSIMFWVFIAFIIGGKEAIMILFERGNFTSEVTRIVYVCCIIYMVGLPVNIMREIIYRYFYAQNDTKTPLKNGIIASFMNLGLSILLSNFMGVYGIVLATTITAFFSFFSVLFRFRNNLNRVILKKFAYELLKVIVVAAFSVIIGLVLKNALSFLGMIFNLVIYEIICLIVFVTGLFLLHSTALKVRLD